MRYKIDQMRLIGQVMGPRLCPFECWINRLRDHKRPRLEKVAMRHGAENADENGRQHERAQQALQEDRVLNLAQRGLLNPDLAIENAADDVALGVLWNPGLVFKGIRAGADERVMGSGLFIGKGNFVRGIGEKFPWTEVTVVHAVEDHAHAFPSGDECGDTDEPADEGKNAPGATSRGESDEQVCNEAGSDGENSQTTGEDDAWTVAVADSPSDEVGVGLPAESKLHSGNNIAESRGVCGVLKSVKKRLLLTRREVEFAWGIIGDVDGNNARDLVAIGLSCD